MDHLSKYLIGSALLFSSMLHGQCLTYQPWTDSYIYTDQDVSQDFIPCADGPMERVDVYIHNFLTGEITVAFQVYEGSVDNGTLLYSTDLTVGDEWGGFHEHELDTPVWLDSDNSYTLRFDFMGAYGACWLDLDNAYEDGMFQYADGSATHMDLGFKVYTGEPPIGACVEWTGAQNKDWNLQANWYPQQIPDSTTCVLIPTVETGNYPKISEKAEALSLLLDESASLQVDSDGELEVFSDLNISGTTSFNGDVIMNCLLTEGTMSGQATFERLTVIGSVTNVGALTIRDLLDLSEGQLFNFFQPLTVNVNEDDMGHVYAPGTALQSSIILNKEYENSGPQLVSAPISSVDVETILGGLDVAGLEGFSGATTLEEFGDAWEMVLQSSAHQPIDAYRLETQSGQIHSVSGVTSSAPQMIEGSSIGDEQGDWKFVGNPYPSILDWQRLSEPLESTKAIYAWNEKNQQFSTYVNGLSVNGGSKRIKPMDGFFVRLPEQEQISIDYESHVLPPTELYEEDGTEVDPAPTLKLKVETQSGTDRTLIKIDGAADNDVDQVEDGFKIPSMVNTAPTLGTISTEGYVLSINCKHEPENGIVPLYFSPGTSGMVTFLAELIEHFALGQDIFLEDRALEHFHDLTNDGSYSTEVEEGEVPTRFFLHFFSNDNTTSFPAAEPEAEYTPPAIISFDGQVQVTSRDQTPVKETIEISIYSMNGALVYSDRKEGKDETIIIQTYVAPGFYLVRVDEGGEQTIEKVRIN